MRPVQLSRRFFASPSSQDVSRVARQEGGTTKNSQSAQMQSQMTRQRNQEASQSSDLQSQNTKQANFEAQAEHVSSKLSREPQSVTKEDADLMHRREQRATGTTAKGGLTSQAHSQAAENMGQKK